MHVPELCEYDDALATVLHLIEYGTSLSFRSQIYLERVVAFVLPILVVINLSVGDIIH